NRERSIASETQRILNEASSDGIRLTDEQARALAAEKVARDERESAIKRGTNALDKEKDAAERYRKSIADLQSDLIFENQQLGRSPVEQRVHETLRSVNVDINSQLGQQIANQVRINEQIREQQTGYEDVGSTIRDSIGGALSDVFSGGVDSAEDFFDRLSKGFASIGQQYTQMGIDRLMGNVFPSTGGQPFSVSGRQAQGMDLSGLSKSLQTTSKTALDVARQFEGLNERADSKVLDSFLQASGNWKGMSVQDFAWCASFANASLAKAGMQGTGSNMASSFLNWGTGTDAPKIGDVVVLRPQTTGSSGHVGFVAGFKDGSVDIFGGNQSHGANVKSYGLDQVVGFRTADMTRAVSDGFIDAGSKISGGDPWNSGGVNMRQAGGAGGGMMGGGGPGMQMLGVGVGSFFQGMESGNPMMGGLSGGLAAFGAGMGPLGIAGGAIAGIRAGKMKINRKDRQ
ncbi:MAG TPA: TIGR02594 family protein, partial [Tianweitania sediminis]|nr:TIGR02594 family protein [Tianweitania sediminis]